MFVQVVDVLQSSVLYTPTKAEIKLKKAEPMSWSRLEIPRATTTPDVEEKKTKAAEENYPKVDAIDLSDI